MREASPLVYGRAVSVVALVAGGAAAAKAVAQTAQAATADDRHDGRRAVRGQAHGVAADGAGERGDELMRAGEEQLDGVIARDQASDDQRLVELDAAAGAQGEDLAAGEARAGDADIECAGRAALLAAGLQNELMDDEGGAVLAARAAQVRLVAADRMNPLGPGAGGCAATKAAARAAVKAAVRAATMTMMIGTGYL